VQAVLAALFYRNRTGQGQRVSLSLWNSLLSMKTIHLSAQSDPDRFEGPRCATANVPVLRGYRTADVPITFAMGGVVGKHGRPGWVPFCQELGLDSLLEDPRFDKTGRHDTGLGARAIELKGEYEKYFEKMPSALIVETARKHGGIASQCIKHDELFESEQAKALEVRRTVPDGMGGEARVLAFPAHFSRTPIEPRGVAPRLGQHTTEVALEFGISQSEVDLLVRHGAFIQG
jgi:crotonobetainyl-CoA:carnitine CoA-transferase CaiB-like acyl-CoA transferase